MWVKLLDCVCAFDPVFPLIPHSTLIKHSFLHIQVYHALVLYSAWMGNNSARSLNPFRHVCLSDAHSLQLNESRTWFLWLALPEVCSNSCSQNFIYYFLFAVSYHHVSDVFFFLCLNDLRLDADSLFWGFWRLSCIEKKFSRHFMRVELREKK